MTLTTRLAFAVVATWLVLALAASWLAADPYGVRLDRLLWAPGSEAWLGRDELGRPVWDRLLHGARVSLVVALVTVAVSASIGIAVGTVAGLSGGWVDRIIVRIIDVFLAFPGILLAIALAGLLGPGIGNLVIALSVVGWVGFARLSRAQVAGIRQRDHVLAAQALGTARFRIVVRHILPLAAAPLIVEATFGVSSVIVAEAGLSFLGLGVQPPEASWGTMIRDGVRFMLVSPHLVLAPGVALVSIVLAVNLLGDAMRDHWDVRREPGQEAH